MQPRLTSLPHIDAAVNASSGNVPLADDASKLWQGKIFVANPPVSHTGTHHFQPCSVRDAHRFRQWTLTLGAATYFYWVSIADIRAPATILTIPAHPLLRKISTRHPRASTFQYGDGSSVVGEQWSDRHRRQIVGRFSVFI
jgi:hypothetical protein